MILRTKEQYIDHLHYVLNDPDYIRVGDTTEDLACQLLFKADCDLTGLSPVGYSEQVWDGLDTVMRGLPLTAIHHSNLDYYCKNGAWMTPAAVLEYGTAFSNLPFTIQSLQADPETRRAVISIAPLTGLNSIQWLARDTYIDASTETECISIAKTIFICIANFRSLDAMHLPTDLYILKRLTATMTATMWPLDKVAYAFNVGSFHIYDKDIARIETMWEEQHEKAVV